MSSKNRLKKRGQFYTDRFWESAQYNARTVAKNLDMLLALAINRFRWVNMPDTCDARFFEKTLHRNGIATLSYDKEQEIPIYTTLQAIMHGDFNMYGLPVSWRAVGFDAKTQYDCTGENGELCYYSYSRISPWNALEIYARKMAHYERTEDCNLTQQMNPRIFIAPQEKKLELVNLLKQIEGGEPAILGDKGLSNLIDNVKTIETPSEMICEELARGRQNVLQQALFYLGIPALAFEKGERMIQEEARAMQAPTNIMLLDCLNSRREFCRKVNDKFGLNIEVYFNDDWESYNFNYVNNIEAMAQDKVILSNDGSFSMSETLDIIGGE